MSDASASMRASASLMIVQSRFDSFLIWIPLSVPLLGKGHREAETSHRPSSSDGGRFFRAGGTPSELPSSSNLGVRPRFRVLAWVVRGLGESKARTPERARIGV